MSLFHVNDDSYFKDWGWNILCKRLRVNSHMIAPMKKGLLWQTVHNVILYSCRHMLE